MINGWCFTNMDKYKKEKWPVVFSGIPRIGDRVASQTGKELIICRVTHTQKEQDYPDYIVPYIVVELTNSRGGVE